MPQRPRLHAAVTQADVMILGLSDTDRQQLLSLLQAMPPQLLKDRIRDSDSPPVAIFRHLLPRCCLFDGRPNREHGCGAVKVAPAEGY